MSRVGKQPINIPENVNVTLEQNHLVVKGTKGELVLDLPREIKASIKDKNIIVALSGKSIDSSMHGLYRTLINNLIIGVSTGFSKEMELVGTGYRVKMEGKNLSLSVGFSHPVIVTPSEDIEFNVEGDNIIKVSGIKKDLVGQVAADLRAIRPPDPYKGKGIRYRGEYIKTKPGKQTKGAA